MKGLEDAYLIFEDEGTRRRNQFDGTTNLTTEARGSPFLSRLEKFLFI